jgi:ABC-type phosphate/phosphonate transport system substrate-binding protein
MSIRTHTSTTPRPAIRSAWLACLSGVLLGALPAGLPAGQELRVAFTQHAFSGVNRADAEAAFKVFVGTMAVKRGWDVAVDVRMVDRPTDLDAAIDAGAVNLLVLDTWTYLESAAASALEPVFVSSEAGDATKQLVLLTRRDSGLDSLDALRGRTLVVQSASNATLGFRWLQTVCADHGLGAPADFFGPTGFSVKPSQAVLPVFFRKRDVCLVDSASYAVMAELNPQISRELQVVASSQPMVDTIICLSREGWPNARFRANVIEALAGLQLEPAGQQILTLFRSGPLLPHREDHLDTVRQLHAHAATLHDRHAPTAGDPVPGAARDALER